VKTSPSDLIDQLVEDTKSMMKTVKDEFLPLDQEALLLKPDPYRWSIGECLEHLNLYSDYYHPVIKKKMEEEGPCNPNYTFKSGMAGNYFAKSMLPKKKMMKMSSPADKNPSKTGVLDEVVKRFLAHQKDLLQLLATARNRDLNKIRIPLSLSKLIRFRLGDTFRFVVNHNQRHVVQAIGNLEK
jgi:hypothetical protein